MIRYIVDCGNGFIGGELQAYGILHYELTDKIVIDDSFEEFKDEAIEARAAALKRLEDVQENTRKKAEEAEVRAKNAEAQAAKDSEVAAENAKQQQIQVQKDKEAAEAEAQAKLESNKAHIGRIRKAAKESFMSMGYSEGESKKLVMAISDGKIENITINY